MAQSMYLVSVSNPQGPAQLINGVVSVVVNASSAASAKTNAALAASAAFKPSLNTDDTESDFYQSAPQFSANYFDTAVAVSASAGVPAAGNGSVNGDAYVNPERSAPVYVDHSAYTPVA